MSTKPQAEPRDLVRIYTRREVCTARHISMMTVLREEGRGMLPKALRISAHRVGYTQAMLDMWDQRRAAAAAQRDEPDAA